MTVPVIGFVGFGEAAQCFAGHLAAQGVTGIVAFCEGRTNRPPYSEAFQTLARKNGVVLLDTLDSLMATAEIVFSAVVVATATAVGAQIAERVRPGMLVVDVNASTPRSKKRVAQAVSSGGGAFVDANLMGAVPIYGATVPLYCSGDGVGQFAARFGALGLRIEDAGPEAGAAAAVKMLRSVVTKGIEALLIEALTAATAAGVRHEAIRSICAPMDATSFSTFLEMCVRSDVLHAERRAVEMEGVAEGLDELGLSPTMTRATIDRLRASAALGLRERFTGGREYTVDDVLDAYAGASSRG